MIPSSSPNAEQKRWLVQCVDQGSAASGSDRGLVVHHPVGRSAKHNKVHIGHWFILPLLDEEHVLLHKDQHAFELKYLKFQPVGRWDAEKFLFFQMVAAMQRWGMTVPDQQVLDAIADYHK